MHILLFEKAMKSHHQKVVFAVNRRIALKTGQKTEQAWNIGSSQSCPFYGCKEVAPEDEEWLGFVDIRFWMRVGQPKGALLLCNQRTLAGPGDYCELFDQSGLKTSLISAIEQKGPKFLINEAQYSFDEFIEYSDNSGYIQVTIILI